jgi:prophage DNA circulation protein
VPYYTPNNVGGYDYTGISPVIRVFKGRGVFCGKDANQRFNALAVIMALGHEGELFHPLWGTSTAYLTDLQMEQESRPEYIVYSFTFRETDEHGCIPRLPEIEEKYG